jgi:putative hydrolase of the HAD superfamily
VSLVIFDLDNTLIDREASFRRWARRFVARRGLDPAEVRWLVEADGDGFVPRARFLSAARERYGLDTPVDALLGSYQEEIVALVELDPQVPAALDRLRRDGWRVAIASNGSTRQQSAKIHRTGLDAHVDAIAISEEVGATKPDRCMFDVAAQATVDGLSPWRPVPGNQPALDTPMGSLAG